MIQNKKITGREGEKDINKNKESRQASKLQQEEQQKREKVEENKNKKI